MQKKTILILLPTIDIVGPRSIRSRHIAQYLANDYDVNILSFKTNNNQVTIPNVNIARLVPSFFISLYYKFSISKKKKTNARNYIKTLLKRRAKKLFFPDPWISEHNRVLAYLKNNSITKIDYIIASLGPYSNARLGMRIKNHLFNNAKVVLDIGDPLVNNIENIKQDKKYISFENNVLQTADHIIVTNIKTKDDFISRYNINNNKISIVGQGVSKQFVEEIISYKKQKTDQIKIFYAGAFYKNFRDPTNFLNAIEIFNNKNIVVDIYDSLNFITKDNDQVSIYTKVSQEELIPYYQEAHILLFFDNAEGVQTPGKIYELLAMQKPILFISSHKSPVLKDELIGLDHIIFCKNEVEEIKKGIAKIINKGIIIKYKSEGYFWKDKAEEIKKILKNEC